MTAPGTPRPGGREPHRREYQRRMLRVLDAIDRQLDQPLTLGDLARIAGFSPFHFHRMFLAWQGETPGHYLARRRLEVAAMRLAAQPRLRATEVALAVGFGSPEAFSRAFRAHFGMSPTAWRRDHRADYLAMRKMDQAPAPRSVHAAPLDRHPSPPPWRVDLCLLQPLRVASFRRTGAYGPELIQFWNDTVLPWAAARGLLAQPRFGVALDDPSITAPERCRYDACIAVPLPGRIDGGATEGHIAGGWHGIHRFSGSPAELADRWCQLLRDWLPASGYQLGDTACFERHVAPEGERAAPPLSCELCMPLAPL